MGEAPDFMRRQLRQLKVLQDCSDAPELESFAATPHQAFRIWLLEAIEAGVKEPHAMTLSTINEDGWPDARVLILKDIDARGWHFAVKATSPKGQQIASNNRVALSFYWPSQGRQIRIRGKANQLSDDECARDFSDRPRDSKISALASKQSSRLHSRDELLRAITTTQNEYSEQMGSAIDWKVYVVAAEKVEFWQGAQDRLHHRWLYTLDDDKEEWEKHLLWP